MARFAATGNQRAKTLCQTVSLISLVCRSKDTPSKWPDFSGNKRGKILSDCLFNTRFGVGVIVHGVNGLICCNWKPELKISPDCPFNKRVV